MRYQDDPFAIFGEPLKASAQHRVSPADTTGMSSALPEPQPKSYGSLRAVKPADPTESSEPSSHAESNEPKPVGTGFLIGWSIFRIMIWATIAVWMCPQLLDYVGGDGVARWLLHHGWARLLGVPPLGLLGLISAFEVLNTPQQRAAREEVARGLGATVVELNHIDPTYGLPSGPGLRVPLGDRSMVVGTWKSKDKVHTVASVKLETRTGFSFVARGTDREPAMMRGLQQMAMGHAMRHMAEQTDDPRAAAAAATMAYMAEPPITCGDDVLDREVVLRANHPDTARSLFTSSAVASAITALNAKTRQWDWTFYPTSTSGMAEMRLECPGALSDAESLRLVQALLRAALEEMARASGPEGPRGPAQRG
jgi:alkylhydroperoxidase family enzyme